MPKKSNPPHSLPLIVVFIVISIFTLIMGFFYYNYQKKSLLNEKQLELSAISYLKIRQITQWRMGQINNGTFLGENILLVKKHSDYLKNPSNLLLKKEILQSLKSLTENFDYRNALLIDKTGNVSLSYPSEDSLILRNYYPG